MERYDFYKNKFDRELNRRNELDNAISNPVLGLTIIVGICSYILTNNDYENWDSFDCWIICILVLTSLFTIISIVLIFLSYNNLFKGFKYLNFGLLSEYYETERKFKEFKKANPDSEETFEEEVIKKIIIYSDNHTEINDKRGKNLYYARTFIIISFIFTIINLSLLTTINLPVMMSDDNNNPAPSTQPEQPRPEPPRMPTDRIEKGSQVPTPTSGSK